MVATFGDRKWQHLADLRAAPSARLQGVPVVTVHGGDTIAEARNAGARFVRTEWIIFLDADDELEPGYVDALGRGTGDLRAPAVRYVDHMSATVPDPIVLADRDITHLNPCVIGTAIRRAMFDDVGGFWEERAWEDWSLFRRCWLAGAVIEHIPGAVYRVNVNQLGRNSTITDQHGLHRQILRSHRRWHAQRKRA